MTAQECSALLATSMKEQLVDSKIIKIEILGDKKQWLPNKLKRLIRERRSIDKEARKGNMSVELYEQSHSNVRKAVRTHRRVQYLKFIKRGIEATKAHAARPMWQWLKKMTGRGKKSVLSASVIDHATGRVINENSEKLEVWATHFESLSLTPTYTGNREQYVVDERIASITDASITWIEVISELKCTANMKASGDDYIPSELYKLVQNENTPESNLAKWILVTIQKVFEEGIIPVEWRNCTVVPIFKKGDDRDPNNYRGISLINTLLKLLCKIIARRIQTVTEMYQLLRKEQVGFIRSEECVGQVAALTEICQRRKIRDKPTIVCFLDLKKAYDMVPHIRLIEKLKRKGFGNKFIKFMTSLYENTKMKVRVGTDTSRSFDYGRGVRQGCPTSPLVFNYYINDLLDGINPIQVEGLQNGISGLMFADDTVIFAESFDEMNEKLVRVSRWMDDNLMEVNPSKCGVLVIGEIDNLIPVQYKNETIQVVDRYVYLGVEMNNQLDYDQMARFRVSKGIGVAESMKGTMGNSRVPLISKQILLKHLLQPTLLYGCEIFGMNEKRLDGLSRVMNNSMKTLVRKHNFCRNRVYEELDIKPLSICAAVSRARCFTKMKESNGVISELIHSTEAFKARKKTWCTNTKVWLTKNEIPCNLDQKETVLKTLAAVSKRHSERDKSIIGATMRRLNIYSGKDLRILELNQVIPTTGMRVLFQLRTGTFRTINEMVITGRINPAFRSKCIMCNSIVKEDANHLLLECDGLREERAMYLSVLLSSINEMPVDQEVLGKLKTKILMGGEVPAFGRKPAEVIPSVAKYLLAIVIKRSALIADNLVTNM